MRYEYGVQCRRETFWPHWGRANLLARLRIFRWWAARRIAKDMDAQNDQFGCAPHRVVRRPSGPTQEGA